VNSENVGKENYAGRYQNEINPITVSTNFLNEKVHNDILPYNMISG
jgi:hypothetical protein